MNISGIGTADTKHWNGGTTDVVRGLPQEYVVYDEVSDWTPSQFTGGITDTTYPVVDWTPSRPMTAWPSYPIYEINSTTFGRPVEYVPAATINYKFQFERFALGRMNWPPPTQKQLDQLAELAKDYAEEMSDSGGDRSAFMGFPERFPEESKPNDWDDCLELV
mgnify:CR=1 FL=1